MSTHMYDKELPVSLPTLMKSTLRQVTVDSREALAHHDIEPSL